MNKIYTLEGAIETGKPFQPVHINPGGHRDETGHSWYLYCPERKPRDSKNVLRPFLLQCMECGYHCAIPKVHPDEFIVWQDEDDFEEEAQDIIRKLGLTIRETVE